jgi:hypothetical protein
MWSVTVCGWEIMITCEPSTSMMSAPARWASARTRSAPAALSPVATTAQDGSFFQAAGPDQRVRVFVSSTLEELVAGLLSAGRPRG